MTQMTPMIPTEESTKGHEGTRMKGGIRAGFARMGAYSSLSLRLRAVHSCPFVSLRGFFGRDHRRINGLAFLAALLIVTGGPAAAQMPVTRDGGVQDPPLIQVPPPASPAPYLPFPQFPALALDERNNGVGVAQQTARTRKLQARILWIDATANLDRINTTEKIAALVERIRATGFNTIVLDVKPIVGLTLYPSRFAPRLTQWTNGRSMPAAFDPVAPFVERAHAAGLQIVASLAPFSEGHQLVHQGPGYDHPEWQTVLYEPQMQLHGSQPGVAPFPLSDRANQPARSPNELAVYADVTRLRATPGALVALVDRDGSVLAVAEGEAVAVLARALPAGVGALVGTGPGAEFLRANARVGDRLTFTTVAVYVPLSQRPEQQIPLMSNPNSDVVRRRLLDMLTELMGTYTLDGVIFDDRLRYAGINADFSEETRRQFEAYVQQPVHWPDDVFRYELEFPSLNRRVVPGPLYDAWIVWRAETIRNWLATAIRTVRAARPNATVSVYSGSWYGEYPLLGSNWAADDFAAGFRFLTPSYQQTGFAGLLDWLTTGCYYPTAAITDAIAAGKTAGASVEAAGQLTNRAANDQTWAYAGIQLGDYTNHPEALRSALQAACATTQGVMVFDLSHFDYPNNQSLWSVFADAFKEPAQAPHAVPGLLADLRIRHRARKAAGETDPPVVIYGGVPGTGL
jgi:uncharacterized lipoprotein YddW (UPF0748 family)